MIPRQKRYHFRKGTKFLNKNGTISEDGQTSSTEMVPFQTRAKNCQRKWYHFSQEMLAIPTTKMVPFQKRVKIHQQKWYHFRRVSNIVNENGTILVRKGSKFLNKNGTISEKGRKSSTKMVPFQKVVKIPQQNGTILGSKESKLLNKNGTISEKG